MGQGGATAAHAPVDEDDWQSEHRSATDLPARAAPSVVDIDSQRPKLRGETSPRGQLIYEFRSMLKNFEARIANPNDIEMVGRAYRTVLDWAKEHDLEYLDWTCRYPQNPVVSEVFEELEADSMYPAWRRQALEEAYMLLYEDVAKQGDPAAVEALPEPHIPQETGYRTIASPLVKAHTLKLSRGRPVVAVNHKHEHTTGSCYCASKHTQYEIRMGPLVIYDTERQKGVHGREIVSNGTAERQCCLDPISAAVAAILPNGCGGRAGADWSSLLGYGPRQGQLPPEPIPEHAPVWPAPPDNEQMHAELQQQQVYAQHEQQNHWYAQHEQQNLQQPKEPTPHDGSSLHNLTRARRDELLQPSVGKEWWA